MSHDRSLSAAHRRVQSSHIHVKDAQQGYLDSALFSLPTELARQRGAEAFSREPGEPGDCGCGPAIALSGRRGCALDDRATSTWIQTCWLLASPTCHRTATGSPAQNCRSGHLIVWLRRVRVGPWMSPHRDTSPDRVHGRGPDPQALSATSAASMRTAADLAPGQGPLRLGA
jgi:hypothetical protein